MQQEKTDVRRLFYWNDSIPGHKDVGPRLKIGDAVEFKGKTWTVERISSETKTEQRIHV